MPLHARRRLAFARLALIAMLLLACAPTVSRLLAASRGPGWLQVCSAQAPSGNEADAAWRPGAPVPGHSAPVHVFEHCPFCTLHLDLATPPPPLGAAIAQALAFGDAPPAVAAAPRGTGAWATAQPRAPPARIA